MIGGLSIALAIALIAGIVKLVRCLSNAFIGMDKISTEISRDTIRDAFNEIGTHSKFWTRREVDKMQEVCWATYISGKRRAWGSRFDEEKERKLMRVVLEEREVWERARNNELRLYGDRRVREAEQRNSLQNDAHKSRIQRYMNRTTSSSTDQPTGFSDPLFQEGFNAFRRAVEHTPATLNTAEIDLLRETWLDLWWNRFKSVVGEEPGWGIFKRRLRRRTVGEAMGGEWRKYVWNEWCLEDLDELSRTLAARVAGRLEENALRRRWREDLRV